MKTFILFLKNIVTAAGFYGKLHLLLFSVLFCFGNELYAGTNPVYAKGRHITRPGLKADALIVSKPNILTLPTLSYNTATPQTYTVGTAVTLTPVSSGVSAPGYSAPVTFASGFSVPYRLAFDAAGNAYVTDAGTEFVVKIPVGGGARVNLGTGLVAPAGVAVDAAGANVYTANLFGGTVSKIVVSSNTTTTIGPKFADPYGVAVDAAGNVYVADGQATAIKEIKPGASTTVDVGSGFISPTGVAVDAAGNVYVADQGNNVVKKVTPGGVITSLGTGLSAPDDVCVDAAGNVYVADFNNNEIKEIPVAGGAPVNVLALTAPSSVTVDGAGIVYSGTNSGTNTVVEETKPGGGYYISAPLPAGLSFSNTTGVISGTPTVAGPAKNYDITAYNSSGSVSASIDMQITSNVNLAGLVLSSGPLTPAFATATTSYTAKVLNAVSSVTVKPTVSDATSTIKVNGTAVASGSVSASLPLAAGPNTISTVVTGHDGTTTQTYTIIVTRGAVIPIFSYSSPQNYNAGAPITPLTPAASNVAAPGYSSTPTILGSGATFSAAAGVAVDAAGNIFTADYGNGTVNKIPAGGGPVVTMTGFSNPVGIAVDAAGNIYVTNAGNNTVVKIPLGTGTPVPIGTGYHNPSGVAVDAAGNVYIADEGSGSIKKISAGTNTANIIATGFGGPYGVALDAAGNIYIADNGAGVIKELPVGGGVGTIISLGSGFSTPFALAVDAAGNIYVCDEHAAAIKKIPAGNGTIESIGSGFNIPRGVAVDAYGNVFVADENNNAIKEITPVGGYYLGNPLPPGLSIDNATGAISGTPTAGPIAAANYMVTAYNANGGSTVTVNIKINNTPTPVLHYAGPQTYHAGTAIAALTPTNTGLAVAAPAYAASKLLLTQLNGPQGVAVDNNTGDIYIAGDGGLQMLPAGGVAAITIPGFTTPASVAVDAAGNVYVATNSGGAIDKILAGTNTIVPLTTGASAPTGVAVDAAGNVYFTEYSAADVKKMPAGGGAPVVVATGIGDAESVAVDAAGNLYVTSELATTVTKIAAGTGTVSQLGSGFLNPIGVAVDAAGNIFVGDSGNSRVMEIPAGSNTPILVAGGFNRPYGTAIDGAGNVYVTDIAGSVLREITPVGGSYIWPFLPPGLNFNNTTGVISGTPTAGGAPTNYTVTSYNSFGAGTATVNIRVNTTGSVATLANLAASSGTLAPAFVSTTTSYAANVANAVSSITITPTATDPNAGIKVNGAEVISGSASANLPLAVGANTITTVVTAQNGTTTKTYTLTVTRAGTQSKATLSALKISAGALSPVFAAATTGYTAGVANTTASITITPTATDPSATITVNGTAVATGTASGPVTLVVGANPISVLVTAPGGTTTQTYTVTVTRAPSTNANLSTLGQSIGGLTPAFSSATTRYTISAGNATATMTLKPVSSDANATIKVNGTAVAAGTVTTPIALSVGSNTITTVVTAQDGTTTKTYTLTVTRAASAIASLSNIKLSNGTLTPAFATATTAYTASVANTVATITITPTTTDANATIKVNGTAVTSGTASGAITLAEGANTAINVVITAQNGTTKETYTVTVTRAPSTNANLSTLGQSAGGLTPGFSSATTSYTDKVSNATTTITLKPVSSDAHATIKVNGTAVTSGTITAPIALAVGPNTITTVVTAQNGTTTKTYTLTVTRAAGSVDGFDPNISVTKPMETPQLADDGIQVHQGVSPNGDGINDFLQIDNISQYPDNKLMIMNRNGQLIYEAKGYDNSLKAFDGHSNKNGQMQLPGTYFYQLDYTVGGIINHKTGFIILKY